MKLSELNRPLRAVWNRIELSHALAVLLVFVFSTSLGSETITLRTWYPSPYGSYRRVKITENLTVGTDATPLAVNGDIVHNGDFTANGLATLTPSKCAAIKSAKNGSLCVDSADGNNLKIYRGGKWQYVFGGDRLLNTVTRSYVWTARENFRKIDKIAAIPSGASYAKISVRGNISSAGLPVHFDLNANLTNNSFSGAYFRFGSYTAYSDGYDSVYSFAGVPLGSSTKEYVSADSNVQGVYDLTYNNPWITLFRNSYDGADYLDITLPAHSHNHQWTFTYTVIVEFYGRG